MRSRGRMVTWNDDKGFGFIAPAEGGAEIFVHATAFKDRNHRPEIGEAVSYEVGHAKDGRRCAETAVLVDRRRNRRSNPGLGWSGPAAALFFLIAGLSVHQGVLPVPVIGVYMVVSLATFIAYARDKSAASQGRWRTSESTLKMLSLMGGWPGAWVAQQTLRHKSRKKSFKFVFWITVILNCSGFIWAQTESGRIWFTGIL